MIDGNPEGCPEGYYCKSCKIDEICIDVPMLRNSCYLCFQVESNQRWVSIIKPRTFESKTLALGYEKYHSISELDPKIDRYKKAL